MNDPSEKLRRLLLHCVQRGASDLHISSRAVPFVRLHGRLEPVTKDPLTAAEVESMALGLMQPGQQKVFQEEHTLDLAYSLSDGERFRINVFRERGHTALAIRRLEQKFRSWEELHLPVQLSEMAALRDGLVLVTGPTGSGKTTTLATLIHQINLNRACHIITIEDPVEFIHRNEQSLIHQRELYADVPSYAQAVRAAMREDPNVILVGEMRDPETILAAITAAETGHLVFSTLHTGDAVGAIDRMIGVFPGAEQESLRSQLSMVLRAVVAQRLLPTCSGTGRVPIVEVLRVTSAVAHLIRSGKPQQIYSAMEVGAAQGMQTMEQALADAVIRGLVRPEDARMLARDGQNFDARLRLNQNHSQPKAAKPQLLKN